MDWKNIDPAMVSKTVKDPENYTWYDPKEAPFCVTGLNWFEQEKLYRRFPLDKQPMLEEVAPGVAFLGVDPTGGQVHFKTDADQIVIAATLTGAQSMDHFCATGQCGIDLYLKHPWDDTFKFEQVTRFNHTADKYVCKMIRNGNREMKEAILNLPLYIGLETLLIGLPKDAKVEAAEPFANENPIVFYGTSVTQGGCASRPGMLYTNILSRWMNREFMNFGFSGSGKGEPEVVELIAQVKDPAMIVINYEANAGDGLFDSLDPMLDIFRKHHPDTPILLGTRLHVQYEVNHEESREKRDKKRAFQRACVERRRAEGDRNIYFIDGRTVLNEAADECLVDGDHPTDLGFWLIAKGLKPVLESILDGTYSA